MMKISKPFISVNILWKGLINLKIYIRGAEENVIRFEINFCYAFNNNIKAAFNPDLTDFELDSAIEDMIQSDYESFMSILFNRFKNMGFEVLEGPNFSNVKNSKSCYFVLCNQDEYDSLTVEFILNVRISDHRLSRHKKGDKNWDRFQARNSYYSNELDNYRELNDINPEDMDFGSLDIIISGQKFKTYRDALKYIVNQVNKSMPI